MDGPNAVSRFLERVAAACLLLMVCVVLFQLIVRTFSLGSYSGSHEFARFLMISMVFLAAPAVLEIDQHMKVDFFVERLPRAIRNPVLVVGLILGLAFAGYLAYSATLLAQDLVGSRTPALRMPMPVFLGGLVVGGLSLALAALRVAVARIRALYLGEDGANL